MIHRLGRRKRLIGIVTAVVCVVVLLAAVKWKAGLKPPLLDGSTTTVVPGIHVLGGCGPAVAYAVETSEGLVLIDSGLDDDAQCLMSQMAKLGLNGKALRAILLTHVHGDHCGGAKRLREATGAMVYAGQGDAPILSSGRPREAFTSTFIMPTYEPHPTTVDVVLAGEESLVFGDVCVRVLEAPGHTLGSVCYLLERTGLRVLFSGDVIVNLGDDPLGTYSAYLAPRYRGDARLFLATLRKLRVLPVPDLLLPGHPIMDRPPRSPRLTRKRWETMLDKGIREMEQLVSRHEEDGADFLDDHPKQLLPDLYYLGNFHDVAIYGFMTSSDFFVIDAPGGPRLADFLKTRLRQLGLRPVEPTAVLLTACGEKETAGLNELVEQCHAHVVASPAGVDGIKRLCPPGTIVVPATDLSKKGWFSVTPIMLRGPGLAPIAYLLEWAGRRVLFSGRIPAIVDDKSPIEQFAEFTESPRGTLDYVESIQELFDLNPDLWLPAVPSNAQNANVYGSWRDILNTNFRTANGALQRSKTEAERVRRIPAGRGH